MSDREPRMRWDVCSKCEHLKTHVKKWDGIFMGLDYCPEDPVAGRYIHRFVDESETVGKWCPRYAELLVIEENSK